MQRPSRRPYPQLELGLTSGPPTPAWSALPEATRQSLTSLLTRLLVAHADVVPQQGARAGGDADER